MLQKTRVAILVFSVSAGFGFAQVGQAATLYTSKSAFLAATTGISTVDFEGLTPPNTAISLNVPATVSGVTFSSPANPFILNCPTFPSGFSNCALAVSLQGAGTIVGTGQVPNPITATLPSFVTAVGLDVLPYNINDRNTVSISTGDSTTFTIGNNVQFIGFTSTTPITSLTLSGNGGLLFDNLVHGQINSSAAAVPEPFTIIGTLIGGTAAFRMRKKIKDAD
ncbi:PEP-CTERM sorting domain-containing protein [Chamaesiphon sp. OTE_20_metabat_361]|uniref:PEP-CTERM sorting domain-containing protein n=1 Tax=Chamaesiphon sp. OTE_20_metabat_361 TaxID=2964689 RepID=UPI00286BA08B|nr:PEP-CTERM sorting domain-containing protein [Chamaesiphon sp. OTE_20_metabat_361]